jgi:hypothetical protein
MRFTNASSKPAAIISFGPLRSSTYKNNILSILYLGQEPCKFQVTVKIVKFYISEILFLFSLSLGFLKIIKLSKSFSINPFYNIKLDYLS